jgi:glycosyltransferase involved in cell wall biosynthesis/GT2 family glycosyltransferase
MVRSAFPSLPEAERGSSEPRRVCVATWEIEGLSRNAGIGTAYTSLADALKRSGHEVTILFLLGCHPTDGNIMDWVEYYRTRKGIRLIPLPMAHEPRIHAAWASSVSYHTYVWLKAHQQDFDIIHFPECQGLGFYSLLARRQGLAFRDCTFVVGTHGPTFWVKEGSQDYLRNLGELEIDYMERTSVAAADVVVSPSQYLLGWMQQNGWELPERTYVEPYVLPAAAASANGGPQAKNSSIREIVFFGRLEIRKGLKLFCDALDELCARQTPPFEVSFLGKETELYGRYGRSSIGYISERSKKWSVPWQIISNKFQAGAMEYLRGPGRMALIASLSDNFPNTVLECLGAGIPLLASNVGGIPEVVAPADRETVCFEPTPDILADRIQSALERGVSPAKPAASFEDVERRWARWHQGLANGTNHRPAKSETKSAPEEPIFPLVSVCFARNLRNGEAAAATLASLKQQDYPNLEIILAECGSQSAEASNTPTGEESLGRHSLTRIQCRSSQTGAGRNAAARQTKGEFLFFVDDHTLLLPSSALSVFVQVAERVRADIVTSAVSFYIGLSEGSPDERLEHSRRPFLGGDLATGAFINCFGSSNALVRRDAFEKIGGFSDEAASTLDDWEIFSKAALAGLRIETMPEVLVWYREDPDQDNMVHSLVNAVRSVSCYTAPGQKVAPGTEHALRKVMRFGQGIKFERDAKIGTPLSRGEQGPAVTG